MDKEERIKEYIRKFLQMHINNKKGVFHHLASTIVEFEDEIASLKEHLKKIQKELDDRKWDF